MLKKIIFTLLLICCCLSENTAKPIDNSETFDLCQLKTKYTSLAPSEKDNNLPASIKVLKMMLVALKDDGYIYITKAKHITDNLLKDPILKENHSVEVKEFMEKIKEFSEKYSKCSDMNEFFKLVILFSTTTTDFYEDETENTDDEKVILEVLKKYKVHEIENEFEKSFIAFVVNLANKIGDLKEELKEEHKDTKKLKWWDEFKTAKTFEEQMELLAKYANLYGMEKND